MEIQRAGSQLSAKGSSDCFTRAVRIDPPFQAPDPAYVQGASVTFEPGAHRVAHAPARSDPRRNRRCGRAVGAAQSKKSALGDVIWFPPRKTLVLAVELFLNGDVDRSCGRCGRSRTKCGENLFLLGRNERIAGV